MGITCPMRSLDSNASCHGEGGTVLQPIAEADIPAEQRQQILATNAERLFGL